MTQNLAIAGHVISASDAIKLVDGLYKHAYELAGQFYENNRSAKFRLNFANAYDFAEANKKTFITQARADFSRVLADPKTPPAESERVYLALLIERAFSEGLAQLGYEADTRLQLMKGTQQFEGDKAENRKIVEDFGMTRNLRAVLMGGAAKVSRMH